MNTTLDQNISGKVHARLANRLKDAGLFGALTEVSSARFMKYVMQPKHIMRNGWLLAPDLELDQSDTRAYVLGTQPTEDRPLAVGQRLVLDRTKRVATLLTYAQDSIQEIQVDMQSMQVLENRFVS